MKRTIVIAVAALVAIGIGVYFYMYKNHRDIASEDADFTITVNELQRQFTDDGAAAIKKYADKTVAISGKITDVDPQNYSVVIDDKLSLVFKDSVMQDVVAGKLVNVKGRFVGYDDLLEEFKMDQASITK